MSDPVYCYPPDFRILRNRFHIRVQSELDAVEREFVTLRLREPLPAGDFDLTLLKAIHRHLFQDIYDWAGEIRTVEISKAGNQFQFRRYIGTGMADVHRRIVQRDFFRGLSADTFAQEAGTIIGDINYVHPFREGNGRAQLVFLKLLAARAGHSLDLVRIETDAWIAASREAHFGAYAAMSRCISGAIERDHPTLG